MAPYGYRWLYMALIATIGSIWLQMAHMAPKLLNMALYGQYGFRQPILAPYGNRWLYMAHIAKFGSLWLQMAHMAPKVLNMAQHSLIWLCIAHKDLCSPLWHHMARDGSTWL